MKLITLYLPKQYIAGLQDLVDAKLYPSRCEAIRFAVKDLLELHQARRAAQ